MDYHRYPNIRETIHPSLQCEKVPNLVKYCMKNNVRFKDKEFFADMACLIGKRIPPDYDGQFDVIEFKSAPELFGKNYWLYNEICPNDIRQGALGNCYFLCCLSSLAEYPDLIRRLFDFDYLNDYGIQSVWLNINGVWTQIVLDEYFPCYFNGAEYDLAFSKTDQAELWVILLEKAYAKAFGCYWDIIGGDPVHALRDLTGAPYYRIEDFSDLNDAWNKLFKANEMRYMITCFTKSTAITEEKHETGIVAGHAYTILDVRDIIDARGRPARVIRIRNPWGNFEWQGDFSDTSPLWTPKHRKELNIEVHDDGVFWMRFEDFVKHYEGIGIVKVVPDSMCNAIMIDQKHNNTSIVRMEVDTETKMAVSIDQIDSRLIDNPNYSYSYFRVTVGKLVGKDQIQFVDSILSPERNIFIEDVFEPGDYVILIEPYWSTKLVNKFNVGTYSDNPVLLELVESNTSMYNQSEYLIWKSFARESTAKMSFKGKRRISSGRSSVELETYQYQNKKYASILYNYVNKSPQYSLHQNIRVIRNTGFNLIGKQVSNDDASLLINPLDNTVLLYKMDPRSNGFSLSHQISSEEILSQKFVEDTGALSLLSSLGGVQPTYDNPEPKIVPRLQKHEMNDKYKDECKFKKQQRRKEREAIKRAEEERRRRLEAEKREIEEERRRQATIIDKELGGRYKGKVYYREEDYGYNTSRRKRLDCTIF